MEAVIALPAVISVSPSTATLQTLNEICPEAAKTVVPSVRSSRVVRQPDRNALLLVFIVFLILSIFLERRSPPRSLLP